MAALSIALLQALPVEHDLAANLARGDAVCRRARDLGADLALFPEMWSNGYAFPRRQGRGDLWRAPGRWQPGEEQLDAEDRRAIECLNAEATPANGPFIRHFQTLATQLQMAIAVGYLEATPGGPRNSVSVIDRGGRLVFTYAKVHTCAFDLPEGTMVPGSDFQVEMLETAAGPVRLGAMICYDREFPESARVLMLKGAEIIVTPNACELDEWRISQFSTRAIENAVGVAMANYPRPKNNGQSCAFHPMLFPEGGGQACDNLIVRAGTDEEIVVARFDLDALRDYRERETFGDAFRRPDTYLPLISSERKEPFVRVGPNGLPYHPGVTRVARDR